MSNGKTKSSDLYPNFRDRSFSEGTAAAQQIPLLDKKQTGTISHGQQQHHPPPYASLMNLPVTQHHQPHHHPYYHPQNSNDKYIPMYPAYPMLQQQQQAAPQPIIMNQIAPPVAAAAAPTSQPTNIVINSNANGGAGGGGSGNRNVAAHALGGFECPFCHLGVVKRRRNPLIKIFILVIAILTFPFGLLACILCWLPCAFQSKCTTCKKKI